MRSGRPPTPPRRELSMGVVMGIFVFCVFRKKLCFFCCFCTSGKYSFVCPDLNFRPHHHRAKCWERRSGQKRWPNSGKTFPRLHHCGARTRAGFGRFHLLGQPCLESVHQSHLRGARIQNWKLLARIATFMRSGVFSQLNSMLKTTSLEWSGPD